MSKTGPCDFSPFIRAQKEDFRMRLKPYIEPPKEQETPESSQGRQENTKRRPSTPNFLETRQNFEKPP